MKTNGKQNGQKSKSEKTPPADTEKLEIITADAEELTATDRKETQRADFRQNHIIISDAVCKFIQEKKRAPQAKDIFEMTGLSLKTIYRHLETMDLTLLVPDAKLRAKRVLDGLTDRAEIGYAKEVELYARLVLGWNPALNIHAKHEHTSRESLASRIIGIRERLNHTQSDGGAD